MAPPVQPEQPWQLSKKPHEWQSVLAQAHQLLQANPTNEQALDAIEHANDALSVYDEAEAQGGLSRLRGGIEGGVGVAESGLHTLAGLFHLPGALYRGAKFLATDPEGAATYANDAFESGMNKLGETLSHPVQNLEESSPREIGRGVGDVGTLLAPFAKTSVAGSLSRISPLAKGVQGPLDAATAAVEGSPSVGGAVAGGVGRAARAIGGAPGRVLSSVESWMAKPGVTNRLNEEQRALAEARRLGVEATNETIIPERAAQARTKSKIAQHQLERQDPLTQAANQRTGLLDQQLERGPGMSENLDLRNELLRRRVAGGSEGGAEAAGAADESGMFGGQQQAPPAPTQPTPTQPTNPFPTNPPQFETHGPAGKPLPPISPSRLIGPSASSSDIETYLRKLQDILANGYQ